MTSRCIAGVVVLGLLGAGLPPPAASQAELPGVFGEVLEVRVVNVEVVVTDRDGIRIRGLSADDFRLWVDGEEAVIEYFTEVRGGEAIEGAVGAPAAVPAVTAGHSVGVSYLLFIDDYFSRAQDRNRVLETLRQQLAYLGPDDRMAVVAYDGRDLEMLSSWSQSPATLDDVLEAATRRPAHGLVRLAELRSVDSLPGRQRGRPSSASYQRLEGDELYYVHRLLEQVEGSTNAVAATLRAFAQPPGRKVAILLSGGWPMDPTTYVVNDFNRVVSPSEPGDARPAFRRLTDTANLLGYTLYTVDVPGLDRTIIDTSRGPGIPPVAVGVEVREHEVHAGLDFLATRTGGETFLNARRLKAIEEIALDTKSYYWLGFIPQRQGSDTHHDIRVEITNPRFRVRFRDGFQDFSRSTEITLQVESALLFGNAPSARTFPLELGEPTRAGLRKVHLPISIAIPFDEITLVPDGTGLVAELELRVAVKDENGAMAPIPVLPLVLRQERPPEPQSYASFSTTVKMRKAPHDLVVTLYEVATGRLMAAEAHVDP